DRSGGRRWKGRAAGAGGGGAEGRGGDGRSGEPPAETAAAGAQAGGEAALASWRNAPAEEISEKQKNDFVTRVDRESEERIVSRIRESFRAAGSLGGGAGRGAAPPASRARRLGPAPGRPNHMPGFPFWSA